MWKLIGVALYIQLHLAYVALGRRTFITSFQTDIKSNILASTNVWVEFSTKIPESKEFTVCHCIKIKYYNSDVAACLWSYCTVENPDVLPLMDSKNEIYICCIRGRSLMVLGLLVSETKKNTAPININAIVVIMTSFVLRCNFHDPSPVRRSRIHPPGPGLVVLIELFARNAVMPEFTADLRPDTSPAGSEVEANIIVTLLVTGGAEGKLVVIAGHAEVITDGLVMISLAIAVGVTQAR